MARRRRGKRRGGKSKAIPLAPILPVAFVALNAYKTTGISTATLSTMSKDMVGYDPVSKTFSAASATPFWIGEIMGIVVHKVANKTINKYVRKATMGYLCL